MNEETKLNFTQDTTPISKKKISPLHHIPKLKKPDFYRLESCPTQRSQSSEDKSKMKLLTEPNKCSSPKPMHKIGLISSNDGGTSVLGTSVQIKKVQDNNMFFLPATTDSRNIVNFRIKTNSQMTSPRTSGNLMGYLAKKSFNATKTTLNIQNVSFKK